jgi:general secretion pathway protein I
LIEVVVAFAIFALSVGAVYECFAGATRRIAQVHDRNQDVLAAQSILSRVRVSPIRWKPEKSGAFEDGGVWRVEVVPMETAASELSPWRAFAVTIHVARESGGKEVVLRSVELDRVPTGMGVTP